MRLAFPLLLLVSGCVIRDVDFSEKRCPCDRGYWCDETQDRCVAGDPPDGGPGPRDAGDAGSQADADEDALADAGDRPGTFTVSNLRAEWATPNGIRWAWDPEGAETDLAYYELHVGTTMDLAGATVWTVDENPELGRYRLPRTGMGDVVAGSITDGLAEDTFYYAQLVAVDTASGVTRSNVAVGHTAVAPAGMSIVLFDDTPRGSGYPLPGCWAPTMTGTHVAGTSHLEMTIACDGATTAGCMTGTGGECWENLREQGLTIDASGLSDGAFASGYLELYLSYQGDHPAWYSEVWLSFDATFFGFAPLTWRSDGEYRRVQIPLRALQHMGTPLTRADLGNLDHWRVGSQWTHGGVVRVDEARIVW